jgi:hypothetical protein
MKAAFTGLALVLVLLPSQKAADAAPEFEKLQASYQIAVERETAPLRQTYLVELTKLRESYTRAGNLAGANIVQAEITAMNQQIAFAKTGKRAPTEAVPAGSVTAVKNASPVAGAEMPELRWFVGKTWPTDALTKWSFEKDGSGEKVRAAKKSRRSSGACCPPASSNCPKEPLRTSP